MPEHILASQNFGQRVKVKEKKKVAFQEELRKFHEIQYFPNVILLNKKDHSPMKHLKKKKRERERDWRTRKFETVYIYNRYFRNPEGKQLSAS